MNMNIPNTANVGKIIVKNRIHLSLKNLQSSLVIAEK